MKFEGIVKSLNSRHSGEACAGLDPVAGVPIYLKRLDSVACAGPRSGVRRNDSPSRFRTFYMTIKFRHLLISRDLRIGFTRKMTRNLE